MAKKIVLWALIFLVLAILVPPFLSLLDLSLNAKNASSNDQAMATKFVQDDARISFGADSAITLKSLAQSDGKWVAEVEIEQNPHTACPKLYRRSYSLMPIYSVTENVLTNCEALPPISNRVEAIIASSKLPAVAQRSDGYACAFKAVEAVDPNYCPKASPTTIAEFASSAQGARWTVAWFYNDGGSVLYALDEKGAVVAQR